MTASPSYVPVTTIDEAVRFAGEDPWGTKLLAGGTALVLMMRQGLVAPDRLVALKHIAGMDSIEGTDDRVVIGACATLTAVAASPVVTRWLPSLADACRVVANVRVRNIATLGGNLAEADYASDPPAVLISLGATCEVVGPDGARSIPVADLITGLYSTALDAAEVITRITVPKAAAGSRATYIKYKSRSSEDRPCVGVASSVTPGADGSVDRLSVAVGAVAPTPQHFPEVTDLALGRRMDSSLAREIAEAYATRIEPMDDLRGSAWYRTQVIRALVARALMEGEEAG